MMLLPPKPGACPICATEHDTEQPHNQESLYYQYRFYGIRGRWPTWADAVAHCAAEIAAAWETHLRALGRWNEPEDGQPIADPPAESIRQAIGDPNAAGFGPQSEGAQDHG